MSYQVTNIQAYFKRYVKKFFCKEMRGYKRTAKFYGLVGLFVLLGVVALAIYINPIPPQTVYIATGQEGSSYRTISQKFQESFKENGLLLELVPTSGLGEGLTGLDGDHSKVSASFLTAGIASEKQFPNLASLGSVQYAPIWIFYKGRTLSINDPFEYFSNKKIAIGPAGNNTNKIFRKLYELNQKSAPSSNNLYELSFKEATDQFMAGKIDAVFIIDGYQSESVQKLLASKDVKIMNFPLADAYIKKLPFLQKLVIPKGSIRLDSVFPSEDITILSSTTLLLVEKAMHPSIQWAYLLSARDIGANSDHFFEKPGFFPKNLDQTFSLTPIAKRFYSQEALAIFSYLPFWLACLIEDIWAYFLAFIVVIFPLCKLLISSRLFPSEHLMNDMFINLRELDEAIFLAKSQDEINDILAALQVYEKEIYETWLYEKNSRFYFNLRNALAGVKRDALVKQKALLIA